MTLTDKHLALIVRRLFLFVAISVVLVTFWPHPIYFPGATS